MSELKRTIASMKVPEHCIQGVMGEWLQQLSEKNQAQAESIRLRVLEDGEFRSKAVDAISDGIVFSTLAVTLLENNDFDEALSGLELTGEPIIDGLRLSIFDQSIDAALETPVEALLDPAFVRARADAFREVCTA